MHWRPIINVDKLWSLVPVEEKKDLTADSEVVPVIDTLRHGYGKVLGNGKLPSLPFIVKARFVSAIAEYVQLLPSFSRILTIFVGRRSRRLVVSSSSLHDSDVD